MGSSLLPAIPIVCVRCSIILFRSVDGSPFRRLRCRRRPLPPPRNRSQWGFPCPVRPSALPPPPRPREEGRKGGRGKETGKPRAPHSLPATASGRPYSTAPPRQGRGLLFHPVRRHHYHRRPLQSANISHPCTRSRSRSRSVLVNVNEVRNPKFRTLRKHMQARQTDFLTSEHNQAINLVGLHVFT